jgi:methylmalonyl-CoA/ethylmalonyl-CoA epimerase
VQIDHIGVAVRSIDAAVESLHRLFGYRPKTTKVTNTRQQVNVVFLSKEGSLDIKLIEPSKPDSPLWDFVRKGGGLHHLCFKVPDVQTCCADLKSKGARVLAHPAPGEAFDDHLISFLYVGQGLNVELIDTDERRNLFGGHT